MEENCDILISKLREKTSLYEELIDSHSKELEAVKIALVRLEDYSLGVKDTIQKIENHVSSQKKDILELRIKQQINADAHNFIDGLLAATLIATRNLLLENEKLILTKKIEAANKVADISRLTSLKQDCEKRIKEILNPTPTPPLPPQAYVQQITTDIKVKNRKHRPDKNPETKAGRAALELAQRRQKAKEQRNSD